MPKVAKEAQNICVRLDAEERERWTNILRISRQRAPHANKSDVARALFRFGAYDSDLVSAEERRYFLGEIKTLTRDAEAKIVGRAVDQAPDVRLVKKGRRGKG